MNQLDTALLTVRQSKSRWCPEGRSHGTENEAPVNRIKGGAFDNSMCLGDRCMFWRWHDQGERHQKPLARAKAQFVPADGLITGGWPPRPDDGRDWQLNEEEGEWYVPAPLLPPRGYCGKAGHPHQAALLEAQIELSGSSFTTPAGHNPGPRVLPSKGRSRPGPPFVATPPPAGSPP